MTSYSMYEIYEKALAVRTAAALYLHKPINMIWNSETSLRFPFGRYYQAGSRSNSGYDELQGLAYYWDSTQDYVLTLSSGVIDNAVINNYWYSVFMTGVDSYTLLPYFRVYNSTYSGTKTIVTMGQQNIGYWQTQQYENNYFTTSNVWLNYRARLKTNSLSDLNNDRIFTISEMNTTSGSKSISFDGDYTNIMTSGNVLQLIPPATTPNLYLGSIWLTSSGTITKFKKNDWDYSYYSLKWHAGVGGSVAGNTFLYAVPPTAYKIRFANYIGDDDTNSTSHGHFCFFFTGDSGNYSYYDIPDRTNQQRSVYYYGYTSGWRRGRGYTEFFLTNNQCIRNKFCWTPGTSTENVPEFAYIDLFEWSE